MSENNTPKRPNFFSIILSTFAAVIGVQSRKNQQRDFEGSTSIWPYIVSGVLFTAIFVISIIALVNWVLSTP